MTGTFHVAAERLDRPGSYGLRDGVVVPIASMYKVLLALEVAEAFDRGRLRPDAPCVVTPGEHTPGGAGLNRFAHPASVSLRDLLYLALAWSDNTASDVLLERVGLDAVNDRAARLGLDSVQVIGGCRLLLRRAGEDLGYPTEDAAVAADWTPRTDDADLRLDRTTRGSAADLARLAGLLARDRAASPAACRLVRDLMRRQVWTARFTRGFPKPDWVVTSKTGTLSPWRGEFGVLERADGAAVAVAVVVRQSAAATPADVVDRAVGAAARDAVREVLA
ncbi:serine hydrolase [Jiangella anatolica]|uniref:Serine hydrolase n=1 Tax=Jiangella anatolica TaxID=2670374 RepID=A0A2W2CEK5_9ACTN|nr:serine hydrolase [Jiangella anatolica]PZF86727.1 serine hydrolase [Jiangella anatolica]